MFHGCCLLFVVIDVVVAAAVAAAVAVVAVVAVVAGGGGGEVNRLINDQLMFIIRSSNVVIRMVVDAGFYHVVWSVRTGRCWEPGTHHAEHGTLPHIISLISAVQSQLLWFGTLPAPLPHSLAAATVSAGAAVRGASLISAATLLLLSLTSGGKTMNLEAGGCPQDCLQLRVLH